MTNRQKGTPMTFPASFSLDGRRAVVTGGTKGAGAAVVQRLKQAGAVRLDRALVPAMIELGAGAIVHFASIQARMPL